LLDITEQDRLNRMRDDFIATVSHELRTPLTSIHGALGLAREHARDVPGDLPRLIAIAHDNSERVVRLLTDVLQLERFDSSSLAFDRAPVACLPLVRDAVHQNQGLAVKFGVQVRILPCRTLPDVFGDRDALLQVLGNLLSNATKFSPAGSFIDVAMAAVDGRVRFSISDQGPGIAPEFRAHVFEKFTQDRATVQNRGGSGLGLSICKRIVEQHGGEIGFESQPGQRTVFSFSIPERPLVSPSLQPIAATIH
jgi:signal transduction histidine kinase